MVNPILDDFDRPQAPFRNSNLWFVAGVGMAILLQAANLLRHYVNWPDMFLHWGDFYLSTIGLLTLLILSAGTILLVNILLRGGQEVPTLKIARDSFGAGALAEGFTQLVKFASVTDFPGMAWTLLSMFGVGAYCAALSVAFTAYRQGRGCLPGIVFFLACIFFLWILGE